MATATNLPLQPTAQPGNATTPQPVADPYPSAELISKVCPDSDIANIKQYAPYILKALCSAGLTSRNQLIAAVATLYVETRSWAPIEEEGHGGGRHGNYFGRGFIQLTWEDNYRDAERDLGIAGLVDNPGLALDPENAAKIFAWFWKSRGVAEYAERGDWQNVRSVVNAGSPGSYSYCWGTEVYEPCIERGLQYFDKPLDPAAIGALPVDGSYGVGCADPGSAQSRTITGTHNPTNQGDALAYALGLHALDRVKSHEIEATVNIAAQPDALKLNAQKTFELKGIADDLDGEYTVEEVIFYPLSPGGLQAKLYGYKPDPNAPAPQVFLHDTNQGLNPPAPSTPPANVPEGSIVLPVPCFLQTDNAVQPDRTCNTSSNAMAAKFLGASIGSDDQYFQIVSKYGDSTSMEAQTAALQEIGISSTHSANLDFDDLDRQLAAGKPITISIAHRGSEDAPNLQKWHVICVVGRTPEGDYIVNDPYGSCLDGYTASNGNASKSCGIVYPRKTLQARWLPDGAGTGWGRLF